MCSNRAEFIESFLGCAWLGAIAVPINVACARAAARAYPEQFRRAAPDHRGGIARSSRPRRHAATSRWSASGSSATTHTAPFDRVAVNEACRRAPSRYRRAPTIPPRYWRSSTRRARPARRKACAARTRNISGGASTACAIWKFAKATCSARRCRCFTPTRSARFYQALLSGSTLVAEPRFSASRFWQSLDRASRDGDLSARRHGADLAVQGTVGRRSEVITCVARSRPACRPISTSRSNNAPAFG